MITEFLQETVRLLQQLDQAAIARARELLLDCYRRQGRVFTAGNGGSASTAQHFACDLAKFVIPDGGRPFDVRCLTDNISLYTAWANDAAREEVFVNQMRGLLRPGDVLILISVHGGKGFSGDLVQAVRYANQAGRERFPWSDSTAASSTRNPPARFSCRWNRRPKPRRSISSFEHLLMDLLKRELAGNAGS